MACPMRSNALQQGARLDRRAVVQGCVGLDGRVARGHLEHVRAGSAGVHMQQVAGGVHDQARRVRVHARQAVELVADGRRPALVIRQQAALG